MNETKCSHNFIRIREELIGQGCCYSSSDPCNGCGNCGSWSGGTGCLVVTYRCSICGEEKEENVY